MTPVPCGHCRGTGHLRMARSFATTLALLSDQWVSTRQLIPLHAMPIKQPVLCNRLAWLYVQGHAGRRPDPAGRGGYQWRRK